MTRFSRGMNNFYPRSPCGERRPSMTVLHCNTLFLSTLSLRRATQLFYFHCFRDCISIHALLAESDSRNGFAMRWNTCISIHALLAESDRLPTALRTPHHRFLSTLSLRRATQRHLLDSIRRQISIHALLAESDPHFTNCTSITRPFLSTLSLRRATSLLCYMIHPL